MKNTTASGVSRRNFFKTAIGGAASLAAPEKALALDIEGFFQKHFKEMDPQELKRTLAYYEKKYSRKYGRDFTVKATGPREGTLFGYGLDLSRCIGCRRCVHACVDENNQSRYPPIQYITVLRFQKDHAVGTDLEHADRYYQPEKTPEKGFFHMPVQCQQCENPPCVKVCPVQATWKELDGIVAIDYNWCIGCRYCMAACPYEARKFNLADPLIPSHEINPQTHYLGNRPRERGVVEKCAFCIQRTREGRYPACAEICPVGARKFGNLLDSGSEIRR